MRLKRPDGHSQIAWQPRSARHRDPPKRPGTPASQPPARTTPGTPPGPPRPSDSTQHE